MAQLHPFRWRLAGVGTFVAVAMLVAAGPRLSSASTAAPAGDEQRLQLARELARSVRDYDEATVGNDTRSLGRLVADDYILVNSDSSVQNKSSYLADFLKPGFKIDHYEVQDPIFRIYDGAALTGGALALSWVQEGRRNARRLRIIHVWAREGGLWRIKYTQVTRVPD